jgi:hypothetical protein
MDMARKIEVFRARFHGRQDIFGRARKVGKEGEERTVYSPVCNNIWTSVCHIERGTGVPCSDCENQLWEPVSDQNVKQHITAHHVHNYYLVLDEGMIRFGAIDFDYKPGKEAQGYSFFEVKKFCKILKARGIDYGIARSTNNGYHVYVFFKEPYPAVRFRAVMSKFFEAAGFDIYVKERAKPAFPEIFPKQDYVSQGFLGNGITPPMIEPLMMKGKKCWVDDNDVMIGQEIEDGQAMIDAQWDHLENLPWADPAAFEKIIEHYALKIEDIAVLKKRAVESASRQIVGDGSARPHGHIEKVLYGCEAFRDLTARIRGEGHEPSHVEGMALWHLAINTVDGKDWFQKNVTTWGRTQSEAKQLEFSIKKNYRPHSCSTMKEQGICHKQGLCIEAAPRPKAKPGEAEITEGALEDLNEQDQKEYNPYRFAFSQGAELLHELTKGADSLLQVEDQLQKEDGLRELARRAQALDKPKVKQFKEYVDRIQKPLKVPKNKIGPMFKAAEEAKFELEKVMLEEDSSVYEVGSYVYRKRYGGGKYGYYQITKGKDQLTETLLLEVDILIHEVRYYMEESGISRTVYRGIVKDADGEKSFEIDTDVWSTDSDFVKFFTKLIGPKFQPKRKQIDDVKQAVLGWSEKKNLMQKVSSLLTQGFYEGTYLMPSVTVDAGGLRPTKSGVLDTSHKDVVKNLDWKILEDDVFQETLRHIKDDFLSAWPDEWTYIGLAHVMRPLMMKVMGWSHFPTLFYDGLSGIGKSELLKILQMFWGNFSSLVNLTVTQKYLEEMAHEFNDACLVLDDFKGITPQQKNAVMHQIQYGYDGSSTGKLNRDSTARKARKNRATLIMSGEGFIQHQASVVARTLLLEVHRFNNDMTHEAYFRVQKMAKNYAGITPRFLHWLLGREAKILQDDYEALRITLYRFAKGRQNASRIAENVAGNHLTWRLFTSFMEDSAVITTSERDQMNERHWAICQSLYHRMVFRCEEEQEATNFKSILLALILSGKVRVEGLHQSVEALRAPVVGYLPDPSDPKTGYYYPETVMNEINEVMRQQGTSLPKKTVGRQLLDAKIIKEVDSDRSTKLVRKGNARIRVWVIDHVALELIDPDVVQETESPKSTVVPLRQGQKAMMDGYGIF